MKKFFILMLLVSGFSYAQAQEGIDFMKNVTWEEVLAKAEKEDKIIFLDAYTTWCAPCKKMDKEIFSLQSVGQYYNEKFINVKMDMEKGEGVQLAQKYNIRAFPTLVFISKDGKLIHRVAGYQNEEEFLALGKVAFKPSQQLGGLIKRFEDGDREPGFLYELAYARKKAADRQHDKVAVAYLATQKDWSSKRNMQFILDFTERADSKAFDYLLDNRMAFNETFEKQIVTAAIENITSSELERLLSTKGDDSIFEKANKLFSKTHPGKEFIMTSSFKMQYYRNQGDRENFATAAMSYVEAMGDEIEAGELSDIAWTFYRVINDEGQLKMALKWAKRAAKMEISTDTYDALASLYYKLGKTGKAKKIATRAIEMAKMNNEDYSSLEELIGKMK